MEQALGVATTRAAVAAAGDPDASGWLTLRLIFEDLSHTEPQVLMLGADAEVVEPAELRDRVVAVAAETAARYN